MARFYGKVGYLTTQETGEGIFSEVITEKDYYGDVIRATKRWENSGNFNDNLAISNIFSIVADAFAMQNVQNIRYILWEGVSWKVISIEIQRPRLILTVGGVYNVPTN